MILKPKLNISSYEDQSGEQYAAYNSSSNTSLFIYCGALGSYADLVTILSKFNPASTSVTQFDAL